MKDEDGCEVCAEAYQLVGQLSDIIPRAEHWLDNLAESKIIHNDLLPLAEITDKATQELVEALEVLLDVLETKKETTATDRPISIYQAACRAKAILAKHKGEA